LVFGWEEIAGIGGVEEMKKKINWDDVAFWIITITLIIVIGYLFITGRAFE